MIINDLEKYYIESKFFDGWRMRGNLAMWDDRKLKPSEIETLTRLAFFLDQYYTRNRNSKHEYLRQLDQYTKNGNPNLQSVNTYSIDVIKKYSEWWDLQLEQSFTDWVIKYESPPDNTQDSFSYGRFYSKYTSEDKELIFLFLCFLLFYSVFLLTSWEFVQYFLF